ncbi:hypothetical protein M1N79_04340 [Dehalococcoidia bacterium]|nr:hypothetical protein [Dehalococcoidia bacterium]
MELPKKVTIVEVGPRDGFQNESDFISTDQKIRFINQLSETGLCGIEETSFVHPKAIPQLADAAEVMAGITRKEQVRSMVLIPNMEGLQRALRAGVKEVDLVVSASKSHNMVLRRKCYNGHGVRVTGKSFQKSRKNSPP